VNAVMRGANMPKLSKKYLFGQGLSGRSGVWVLSQNGEIGRVKQIL